MSDEPSYKLDALGEKYCKLGKIEYNGSLDRLFIDDIDKFIEYNFRDVEILKALDNKFNYIGLTKNLAHKGKIHYDDVYQSSKIHDGAISAYLLSENIVPPSRDRNPIKKANYAGGYLFCPKAGLYRYMFDEDLTSLYPSIIMSLNIGKETLVGRLVTTDDRDNRLALNDLKKMDPKDEFEVENLQRRKKILSVGEILALVEQNKLAITANGVMFRTDKPSTLSVVLAQWFDELTIQNAAFFEEKFFGLDPETNIFYDEEYPYYLLSRAEGDQHFFRLRLGQGYSYSVDMAQGGFYTHGYLVGVGGDNSITINQHDY